MSQFCKICAHPDQAAVRLAFSDGGSDREVGRQLGVSHTAAGRHRRTHIVAPMRAATAALDKGRAVRAQRERHLAAIEGGDLFEILSTGSIAADLRKIRDRLDTSAEDAASANQHTAHAALASQLHRGIELRGKLGGHDKTQPGGSAAAMFSVQIVFSSSTEKITLASAPAPATIEGETLDNEIP
jgi:hypothetical protein